MRAGGVDLRLVFPAAGAWGATGLLLAHPSAGGWCALACAGVALVLVAAAGRLHARRWAGVVVVTLAAIGLASAATALAGATRHPDELDTIAGGHVVVAEGRVASGARAAGGTPFGGGDRVSFHVTVTEVQVGRAQIRAEVPALVYAARSGTTPQIGERVRVTATAKTAAPDDDIALTLYATDIDTAGPPPLWLSWADGLRARFAAASARLPGDGGQLLPGLAIGDETHVSADLDADMKASSLSHLTAVSGSNCAVIIAGLLALGAAAGLPRRWRVGVALVGLAGFVVLVTPGASVLRAAVMASIVVLGTALGRPGRALPALALAVLVLLVHDPWLARDYGFALSVLATAGLLLLAPLLAARLTRWLPRWLAVGLSVPLAAQLACQPVLVLLNPTVPLYGVVANVLAEPAAPVATVIGLIGCLLLPLSAHLAAPLLWAAWAPAAWIAGIARTSTALPGSALPWPGGAVGFGLAVVITALVVVLVAHPATARGRVIRSVFGATAAVILVGVVALQAGPAVASRARMPGDWIVGMCDIGQGDAIVIHDGSRYGLIDTGPDPKLLSSCLRTLGIRRIDLLVLTHYDLDHVGGLDAVADRTQTALVGQGRDAGDLHDIAELKNGGADVHLAMRGDEGDFGALRWKVLWPDGAHPKLTTSNEQGIALELDGRGIRMLFLADLDQKAQDAMIADGPLPTFDIVKVAHHGTADTSERLDALVRPRLGLISCGLGNSYGHPTAKALQLLHDVGAEVARTDLEGMTLVTDHDGALAMWTQKQATDAALWTPARR